MSDTPNKAREMLAAEYHEVGLHHTAGLLRAGDDVGYIERARLRAIEKALTPPMSDADVERVLHNAISLAVLKAQAEDCDTYALVTAATRAALAALASTAEGGYPDGGLKEPVRDYENVTAKVVKEHFKPVASTEGPTI